GPEKPKPGLNDTWMGVSMVRHDGKSDVAFARTIRWTIAGNSLAITDQRIQEAAKGTIDIFGTMLPKKFDAEGNQGGEPFNWSASLELDGDMLKVCYLPGNQSGPVRPKEFKAKPATLLILKRVGSL